SHLPADPADLALHDPQQFTGHLAGFFQPAQPGDHGVDLRVQIRSQNVRQGGGGGLDGDERGGDRAESDPGQPDGGTQPANRHSSPTAAGSELVEAGFVGGEPGDAEQQRARQQSQPADQGGNDP